MEDQNNKNIIKVTSPLLPPLNEFYSYLEEIWEKKWITNNGEFHQRLEKELAEYLGVDFISLFTNGTLPLIVALQVLGLKGEVITTPFSFVATTHSIWFNGLKPVFVDIDPTTCNIDPNKVEKAITSDTTAIMPVHVYGNPCDVEQLDFIAKRHNLKIIYDAAHAFGVRIKDKSILKYGDMSTLSFHATKIFTTFEGGALICQSKEMKQKIDFLKNFGFAGETEVVGPGINAKMDEIRSAFGLLSLKYVDDAIEKRKKIVSAYRDALADIDGIDYLQDIPDVKHNYSYFPIFVDSNVYGMTRDELYYKLKNNNIYSRRYFYPLISSFSTYNKLPSASPENLPNAHKIAESVICLPLYHELKEEDIERVVDIIRKK